jgi:DNA-binding GntR family transcriptional regulator
VPAPTGDDVLETYALRRAVGGLAVSGAAGWRPGQLGPVLQAMDELREIAASGDVRATDEADLDFQDVLATASNLRRVLMMFRRLTIQLKLFTTVMGLNYAYSSDDILADNSAILDAVRRRDPGEAKRLWEQKMEAAARYMVRQLDRGDGT